jgi:hypothetical protein
LTLYPLTRETRLRTVVNALADGHTVVFSDPDAASIAWELSAKGLTSAEWSAVEAFYKSVSGQWQTFTFLDPAGNLLAESEDFGASAWTNGTLLTLTPGVSDPFGTTRATHVVNGGQAAQAVEQTLAVPGNFKYALSVWARTGAGSSVTLTAAGVSKTFALTGQWRRISLAVDAGLSASSVTFAAQLSAGDAVDLFGMQVDAQAGASDYKKTGTTGGVYSKSRFASDAFTVTAQSTDVYDATIRIVSMGS